MKLSGEHRVGIIENKVMGRIIDPEGKEKQEAIEY
jgi:hypothetical protein